MKTRKMCPNCKSTYIGLWMGTDLGMKYQCNECGYIGNIVLEEDIKKTKKYNNIHGTTNKKRSSFKRAHRRKMA